MEEVYGENTDKLIGCGFCQTGVPCEERIPAGITAGERSHDGKNI
jgi:hypothetical protein